MLREERNIGPLIRHLRDLEAPAPVEIIVVDGDPGGGTVREIATTGVTTMISLPGRARQMNAGAHIAAGDVLVFLHADTFLPENAFTRIAEALSDPSRAGGAFDLGFTSGRFAFRLIAAVASIRSRLTRVPFGDQAIFMRRGRFEALGGYSDIPLMEDVDLMRRVRRRGWKIRIVNEKVRTSPRKWEREGVFRTTLRNYRNQLMYLCGVSPRRLYRLYYRDGAVG